jgi:hypothetical protein
MDIEVILKVLAAYGIIHVLAKDLGIHEGEKQRKLVHFLPVQISLLYAGAYITIDNHKLAFITTFIYYFLKYIYSKGVLSSI